MSSQQVIFVGLLALLSACNAPVLNSCPASCDDGNACTMDNCSRATNYSCVHYDLTPCDGNAACEKGEYGSSVDCPLCNDTDPCTTDSYSYQQGNCTFEPTPNCCGNAMCDGSETIFSCPDDCEGTIDELTANIEYSVNLNSVYQFAGRQITISTIWDDAVVVDVQMDTQTVGMRIDKGKTKTILGINIKVIDVTYTVRSENRRALISVSKAR